RACRYAPAPPFHLSSYGEPSKTKPKVRSANHQQNSLFTGNKKETTSDAMSLIYSTREKMMQTLTSLDADINGHGGAVDDTKKEAPSFMIKYKRSSVSGFMQMKYYYNDRKEIFAEFTFFESR
ncbi:hypothetical protein, partial [Oceaniferula marina]|uniref:hypothetical protein n=1 Tax=Oceaniferula marina TaxID=2748318 RepID=UPI001D059DA8